MNTNTTTYRTLQAGQSLALSDRRPLSLVLVEGEVLVQAPAQWLGGAILLLPPTRVAGPQTLNFEAGTSFTATTRAKFAIEQKQGRGARLAGALFGASTRLTFRPSYNK